MTNIAHTEKFFKAAFTLKQFGDTEKAQLRKIKAIDVAWNISDGSILACSRTLKKSMKETANLLANPVIRNIPENDPRLIVVNTSTKQSKAKPSPEEYPEKIVQERIAMQKLKKNSKDKNALATIVEIAQWDEAIQQNKKENKKEKDLGR